MTFKKGPGHNDPRLAPPRAAPIAYGANETAWLDPLERVLDEIDADAERRLGGLCSFSLANGGILQGEYIRARKGQLGRELLGLILKMPSSLQKSRSWWVPMVEMKHMHKPNIEMIPPPWIKSRVELDDWLDAWEQRLRPSNFPLEEEQWLHDTVRKMEDLVMFSPSSPCFPVMSKLASLILFHLRQSLKAANCGLGPSSIRNAFLAGVEFDSMERLPLRELARTAARFSPGNPAKRLQSKKEALRDIFLCVALEIGELPKGDRFLEILEARRLIEGDTGEKVVILWKGKTLSWPCMKTFKNVVSKVRQEESANWPT